MVHIIYAEILKMKRSALPWFIVVISILNVAITYFQTRANNPITWKSLIQASVSNLNSSLVEILFAMIVGFVISREYKQKTIYQWFAYPFSRVQLLAGKLIVVLLMLIATILLSTVLICILGEIILPDALAFSDLIDSLALHGLTMIMQFLLFPFIALISIISRSYIPAIAIGLVTSLSKGIMNLTVLGSYYPWAVPHMVLLHYYGVNLGDLTQGTITLSLFFIITLWLSFHYYCKSEI